MTTLDTFDITGKAREAGLLPADEWTVRLELTEDTDSHPLDTDGYTIVDVDRWRRGEWQYVCVDVYLVTPDGTTWGEASLGGVEHGFTTDDGKTHYAQDHPSVSELISEARDDARTRAQRAVNYVTQALFGA